MCAAGRGDQPEVVEGGAHAPAVLGRLAERETLSQHALRVVVILQQVARDAEEGEADNHAPRIADDAPGCKTLAEVLRRDVEGTARLRQNAEPRRAQRDVPPIVALGGPPETFLYRLLSRLQIAQLEGH